MCTIPCLTGVLEQRPAERTTLMNIYGLCQVICSARLEGCCTYTRILFCTHHNDRNVGAFRMAVQYFDEIYSVHLRHLIISQYQINLVCCCPMERLPRRSKRHDLVAPVD